MRSENKIKKRVFIKYFPWTNIKKTAGLVSQNHFYFLEFTKERISQIANFSSLYMYHILDLVNESYVEIYSNR